MSQAPSDRPPNRLIHETSPYLLQHAYNPVDWHPWGEEALQRARAEDKPILLSIGYSACHWCHVMERESFENDEIAEIMNRHYINIKVDREERPDLDDIYMQATVAMNHGQGGWPMTVMLTPEQQPFFAGTYFPPTEKWGRPGFRTILSNLASAWASDRERVAQQASSFTDRLREAAAATAAPAIVGREDIDTAVEQFTRDFDSRYGGFGSAPKFPPATGLAFLLRHYHRTGHEHSLTMVQTTLDAMASGGLYDHIGGGFARYSTDERWLVPHFEKMLYDNALLAHVYTEAYQVTHKPLYRRVAIDTLDYILRDMTSEEGGFYSATDADSEGVEGKFFVWTPDEIRDALDSDEDARRCCAYFDVTDTGNWEHTNILHTPKSIDEVAEELGCSTDDLAATLEGARPLLYRARAARVPPGLDDKIITAWNGMMIRAMAEAARVFGLQRYLDAAVAASDFLLTTLSRPDHRLLRTYRAGKAHLDGCLEDYAHLADALVDLYEAGGAERYLHEAVCLTERMLEDFLDTEHGGFFTTGIHHETLILRAREGPDGATPSANAVAAQVCARLAYHFQRDEFREVATKAIRSVGRQLTQIPRGYAKSLIVVDLLVHPPVELAFVGEAGDARYEALKTEVAQHFLPERMIASHPDDGEDPGHPLLQGKTFVNNAPALYVCRQFSCQSPVTDPADVSTTLSQRPPDSNVSADAVTPSVLTDTGLPGRATVEGTAAYVAKQLARPSLTRPSADGYTAFGATGLTASRLGFGAYRVALAETDHRDALAMALREGCNVIDTSTNYMDGESERLIGQTIAALIHARHITREALIVVSKVGYVQGQNLRRAEARETAGHGFSEMVKYGDGIWHCLHPEFLEDQLTRSLDRLGLATLDVCLLHNPEYFLSDAKNRDALGEATPYDTIRRQFYERLHRAFAYLETQVAAGRIQYYGVSSNTCTKAPDDAEATSLSRMLDVAAAAAAHVNCTHHHFQVLQLPMNLFESGACLTPNTGADHQHTVLNVAQTHGIAILVNRPLNAMPREQNGMFRLADPRADQPTTTFDAQLPTVRTLEEEYVRNLAPLLPEFEQGTPAAEFFTWAEELPRVRSTLQHLEHWTHIEQQMIAPHANRVFQLVTRRLPTEHQAAWDAWRRRYVPELLTLLSTLRREAAEKSARRIHQLRTVIDPLLPVSHRDESFSRKALWTLASTPGVTCVLNGMRTPAYVEDALGVLQWPRMDASRRIYEALLP